MYNLICVENESIIDTLETENIKEIERFFNKNKYFINLNNNMVIIANMEESECFKIHKNRDRKKYIEVSK